MRRFLILLIGCILLTAAIEKPKPKYTLTLHAAGTDLWVAWRISAPGSDSVQVTAGVTGQITQHRSFTGSVKTDSAKFVRPAPGVTVTATITALPFKGGKAGTLATRTAPYTEPVVVPPALIDSLWLWPASIKVEATRPGIQPISKNQQQICTMVGFRGGHMGFRRPAEGLMAKCDSVYRALPLAIRAVTSEEQAMADGVCVTYTATGGTITPEICSQSPALRFAPGFKSTVVQVEITPAPPRWSRI